MFRSSVGSYTVPRKVRYTMAGVLAATLVANLSSIIMSQFIHQSQRLGTPYLAAALSDHYIPRSLSYVLVEWTAYARGNVSDVLLSLVNSPSNIPNMKDNSIYNIHRSEYDPGCKYMDIVYNKTIVSHPLNSCMQLEVIPGSVAINEDDQWNTQHLNKGNGRGSISMDVKAGPLYAELSLTLFLKYGNITCGLVDMVGNMVYYASNGTTSAPTTLATKCWTAAGEMVVLSMTTVRFSSGADSVYRVATSLIGETALFRETGQAMLNATHATNITTVGFIEYMVDGPSVEIAGCVRGVAPVTSMPIAICSYSTASVIVATSHQFNSTDSSSLGEILGKSDFTTIATIKHLPTNHTLLPFDLRNASSLVADTLASFGFSLIVDWIGGQVLITYDVSNIRKGYDVPNTLIAVAGAILGICLAVSIWSFTFKPIYTESLYNIVTNRFVFHREKPQAMLITCNLDNDMELDGGKITYQKELSAITTTTPLMENSATSSVTL
ncbi:hypothetical protein BGZ97_003152 [Linnemannia gamsii]|uniref:Transmembrane protein n=1 Tax=Linnemannia gamsii TaxID=64522 RepID=A0A9P6QW23_9FUNG|nr:hypothetical protein BGZ97_003152 [Linnemannia gamsii]